MLPINLPFRFGRLKFPVKLCFLITTNNVWHRTLNIVGLDQTFNVFPIVNNFMWLGHVSHANEIFLRRSQKVRHLDLRYWPQQYIII